MKYEIYIDETYEMGLWDEYDTLEEALREVVEHLIDRNVYIYYGDEVIWG